MGLVPGDKSPGYYQMFLRNNPETKVPTGTQWPGQTRPTKFPHLIKPALLRHAPLPIPSRAALFTGFAGICSLFMAATWFLTFVPSTAHIKFKVMDIYACAMPVMAFETAGLFPVP
jgi:hypothetical protein